MQFQMETEFSNNKEVYDEKAS